MKKYQCTISTPNSTGREYITNTRSALKAAAYYGQAEAGEIVEIKRIKSGRTIDAAAWVPEYHDYKKVNF